MQLSIIQLITSNIVIKYLFVLIFVVSNCTQIFSTLETLSKSNNFGNSSVLPNQPLKPS